MMRIDQVFQKVNRANFVPPELKDQAELDIPLPLGFGQTISQPTTVAYMLTWLDPQPGDDVLDVGSGSGWTTALLGELVGPKGRVYAVERIPELVAFGRQNCATFGTANAQFFTATKHYGLAQYAPYNKILVSAAAESVPPELLDQLQDGGRLVIPVKHDILQITKAGNQYHTKTYSGFVFVPLK